MTTDDEFHSFVEILSNDGGKKCKFCGQVFAATTSITRFKWHWSREVGRGVGPCPQVTPEIQLASRNRKRKRSSNMSTAISTSTTEGQTNQVCNLVQGVLVEEGASSHEQAAGSSMQNMTRLRTEEGDQIQEMMDSLPIEEIEFGEEGGVLGGFMLNDQVGYSVGDQETMLIEQIGLREGRASSHEQATVDHMENMTGEMSQPMHTSFTPDGLIVRAVEPLAFADAQQDIDVADLSNIEWRTILSFAEFLEVDIENNVEGLSAGAMSIAPSSSRHVYDVYLNFRGADTRKNFIDHLYAALYHTGTHTFRDDELSVESEIGAVFFNAIKGSKISLAIFSENYASSAWCLDELAMIMDCRNTVGQIVYPVFTDVNPSDIEEQTGCFAEALRAHEELCDEKERVSKWRRALEEASSLPRYALKDIANGNESILIQKIVKEVNHHLRWL